MKIIIEMTEAGDEMVEFRFDRVGETESLPVLRATARMTRAISEEYQHIRSESEFVRLALNDSPKESEE